MTRKQLADAFNRLAEAAAVVAIELEADDAPQAVPSPAARTAAAGPERPVVADTVCPKHRVAYIPSKNPEWQPYCPEKSDDPAWRNAKGYCSIKPSSARKWLEINGAAA